MGKVATPTTHNKKSSKHDPQYTFTLLSVMVYVLFLIFVQREVLFGIGILFKYNVFEVLWNVVFTVLAIRASIRLYLIPLWYFIFSDHQKLGQKLHWYGHDYNNENSEKRIKIEELNSNIAKGYFFSKLSLNQIRLLILIIITLIFNFVYIIPDTFFQKWHLSYSSLMSVPLLAKKTFLYFNQPFYQLWQFLAPITVILWLVMLFEGRSRLILRALLTIHRIHNKNIWKKLLPEPLKSDDEFSLCVFSYFTDVAGKAIYQTSSHEKWFLMTEKSLKTNTLVIAPTGGGKTTAIVVPVIKDSILWEKDNIQKKATLAIYDPKAELTSMVVDLATAAGRENDLCVLSLDSTNTVNPIQIDDIWSGTASWKVASWIVNSWQNFQGKSSSEPYWETQTYILFRNLLVLLYFYHDKQVTIYHLSKLLNKSIKGCFLAKFHNSANKESNVRALSDFGETVLLSYLAIINIEERKNFLTTLDLLKLDDKLLTDELKHFTREKIKIDWSEYYYTHTEDIAELKGLKELIDECLKSQTTTEVIEELKSSYQNKIDQYIDIHLNLTEDEWSREYRNYYYIWKLSSLKINALSDSAKSIIRDACEWFFSSWSSNNEENRGSIVSGPQPFLQQFETPELQNIFSPANPNVDFNKIINEGMIFVPSFSGIIVGQQLSNAIVTLLKSRWQHEVLSNPQNKRIKLQVMDEAQRIITFGGGHNTGDFEYMELSRSFGGITFLLSQSLSAIKAKAQTTAQFDKIHGVVRNFIGLATNDLQSIEYIQKIAGQAIKKRVSKTLTETGQNPSLEIISEKYRGDNDSLGLSYTISEAPEYRLLTTDIQEAKAFTAFASLYDGNDSHIYYLALKPYFWKEPRHKWEYMDFYSFKHPEEKARKFYEIKVN